MRRGQVVLVNLDPARTSEAAKTRPCIVVSNDGSNKAVEQLHRGTVTIVPLTSNTTSGRAPFHVVVQSDASLRAMGLSRASKAQAEQVRTVSVERVGEPIGWTPANVLREVDAALRFHLSL